MIDAYLAQSALKKLKKVFVLGAVPRFERSGPADKAVFSGDTDTHLYRDCTFIQLQYDIDFLKNERTFFSRGEYLVFM